MKHNQNNEPVLTRMGQANAKAMKLSEILTDYRLCLAGLASLSGHIPGHNLSQENSDEAVELQEQTYLTRAEDLIALAAKTPIRTKNDLKDALTLIKLDEFEYREDNESNDLNLIMTHCLTYLNGNIK